MTAAPLIARRPLICECADREAADLGALEVVGGDPIDERQDDAVGVGNASRSGVT